MGPSLQNNHVLSACRPINLLIGHMHNIPCWLLFIHSKAHIQWFAYHYVVRLHHDINVKRHAIETHHNCINVITSNPEIFLVISEVNLIVVESQVEFAPARTDTHFLMKIQTDLKEKVVTSITFVNLELAGKHTQRAGAINAPG